MRPWFLFCALFPLFSQCLPSLATKFIRRAYLQAPPPGFVVTAQALVQDDTLLTLTVGVPPIDVNAIYDALMDVSDPKSPNYGRHWNKTQVLELMGPRSDTIITVLGLLTKLSIQVVSTSPTGLTIQLPVAQANSLFDADFRTYLHLETNTQLIRTLSYSIPAEMDGLVSFIHPASTFELPLRSHRRTGMPSTRVPRADPLNGTVDCSKESSLGCLRNLYHIPSNPVNAHPSNRLAIGGLNGGLPDTVDLGEFLARYRPEYPSGVLQLVPFNGGGRGEQVDDEEAALDTEYALGLATNITVTLVNISPAWAIPSFLQLAVWLLYEDTPPLVVSTSYGIDEYVVANDQNYLEYICSAYAALGLRGITLLFSSGDGGMAGCKDDTNCIINDKPQFIPTFPSTCPYVTSVGSTTGLPETAASFSSGGFSNIFRRPTYQDGAVTNYFSKLGKSANDGWYNVSGRGYPDVSTQGTSFPVIFKSELVYYYGTSTSAPTFASIISLLNNMLLDGGKPPLGFLNPLLYSQEAGKIFNDITSGKNNQGCASQSNSTNLGFPALEGWDPVTGLGTPDYERWLDLILPKAQSSEG